MKILQSNLFNLHFRDIFSLGFGPFRWVCASGDPEDLAKTDDIAYNVLQSICDGKYESFQVAMLIKIMTYNYVL